MSRSHKSHKIKTITRGILLFIIAAAVIALAIFFRPKDPLSALADLASQDQPERATLTAVIISASSGSQTADTFTSTQTTFDAALSSALDKITQSPDYKEYKLFRIDVVYGADATNIRTIIENLPTLTDHSYFTSPTQPPIKLSADLPELSHSKISDLIQQNALYLARDVDEDGKFLYGRNILTGEELADYSINAHTGATAALLRAYSLSHDAFLLEQAEKTISYLINFIVNSVADPTLAYTQNAETTAIDLGATASSAIVLADYRDITDDTSYDELLQQLLNGVESMYIGDDCHLYGQELELDLTPRGNFLDGIYNAQATYALIRAYNIFEDKAYIDQAARNIDFMLEREYTTKAPYWFPLAVQAYNAVTPDTYTDIDSPLIRSPEEIFMSSVQPWYAMFATYPDSVLHAFINPQSDPPSDFYSTLDANQSALFELIDFLDANQK